MSENDVLIEMRRLRGELGDVRARLNSGRRRSSSFRHDRATLGELRGRAGAAMLATLAIVVAMLCWSLYRLLAATLGSFFQDLLPHPIRATASVLFEIVAAFF